MEIYINLFTFLAGLLIGHRLTLLRDKRKEFNDATNDIYFAILTQIKDRSVVDVHINVIALEHFFCFWNRHLFRKEVEQYIVAKKNCTTYVNGYFSPKRESIDTLITHAESLSKFLRPR